MGEDMSDIMSKLNGMLKNGDIPDNIKEAMNSFTKNTSEDTTSEHSSTSEKKSKQTSDSSSDSSGINPDMIRNIMSMFNASKSKDSGNDSSSNSSTSDGGSGFNIDIETMMKMGSIMEKMNSNNKDDPRSNLLLSLKPYLKDSRKDKVEQYIKFLNMSKVIEVLNPNGGDKAK